MPFSWSSGRNRLSPAPGFLPARRQAGASQWTRGEHKSIAANENNVLQRTIGKEFATMETVASEHSTQALSGINLEASMQAGIASA